MCLLGHWHTSVILLMVESEAVPTGPQQIASPLLYVYVTRYVLPGQTGVMKIGDRISEEFTLVENIATAREREREGQVGKKLFSVDCVSLRHSPPPRYTMPTYATCAMAMA